MRLKQFLIEDITRKQLTQLENYADRLFAVVNIDVEFTRHFFDRVNDKRNKGPITFEELRRLFRESFTKHGRKIPSLGNRAQAVIQDMVTDINMPFVLNWDNRSQEFDLVAKTVMRKKGFKTSNPKLRI